MVKILGKQKGPLLLNAAVSLAWPTFRVLSRKLRGAGQPQEVVDSSSCSDFGCSVRAGTGFTVFLATKFGHNSESPAKGLNQ